MMERPDGVAPSSHAGEPRSSDGRAAQVQCRCLRETATAKGQDPRRIIRKPDHYPKPLFFRDRYFRRHQEMAKMQGIRK